MEAEVTADDFRALALDLPAAIESAHMGHPDFRVDDRIFATLGPKEAWGMVKLTPEQQQEFMRGHPGVFEPSAGAWGRKGATKVILERATKKAVKPAIVAAWRNIREKA